MTHPRYAELTFYARDRPAHMWYGSMPEKLKYLDVKDMQAILKAVGNKIYFSKGFFNQLPMIVSEYEKLITTKCPDSSGNVARNNALAMIARLIGISDFKEQNTVCGEDGLRKFVDCAAIFSFSKDMEFFGMKHIKDWDDMLKTPKFRVHNTFFRASSYELKRAKLTG